VSNIWFLIIVILLSLSAGYAAARNGEPKEGNYDGIASFIVAVIYVTLTVLAIQKGF